MDIIIVPLFGLLQAIISLYQWVIIIHIILSWLVAFNVINTSNEFVRVVSNFLYSATEPVLQKIRKILPSLSGLDLSPLVLLFALMFLSGVLRQLAAKLI